MAIDVTTYTATFARVSAARSESTVLTVQQMLVDLARTKATSGVPAEKKLATVVLIDSSGWAQRMINDVVSNCAVLTPTEVQFQAAVAAAWQNYVDIDAGNQALP
jgi:hypothetical protein